MDAKSHGIIKLTLRAIHCAPLKTTDVLSYSFLCLIHLDNVLEQYDHIITTTPVIVEP